MRSITSLFIVGGLLFVSTAFGQATTAPSSASQPSSPPAPVKFTPIAHIEKRGDGPVPMVLIPGLSCDWTVFDAFMKRNEHAYTMYALTLPGFGSSDAPPKPADGQFGAWLDNADQAIWKVIQDQKINRPVIVGHSLGGHLALRLGTEHANNIRAVVSIDGAPAFPLGMNAAATTKVQRLEIVKGMEPQFKGQSDEQWAANQRQMVTSMVTDPKRAKEIGEMCSKVPAATTVQYMLDLMSVDIRDQLSQLTCSALVLPTVSIQNPAMVPVMKQMWTDLMKGAPTAKLAFFEDTRHFIQDDRPAELDAAISDFLASREVKGYTAPPAASKSATKPTSQPAH